MNNDITVRNTGNQVVQLTDKDSPKSIDHNKRSHSVELKNKKMKLTKKEISEKNLTFPFPNASKENHLTYITITGKGRIRSQEQALNFDLYFENNADNGIKSKIPENEEDVVPIEEGILSNIQNLKLDFSDISDSSPICAKTGKQSSTQFNADDYPFYTWTIDKEISEKNYPPKTKVCKEESACNTPNSQLNFSTFSTFLENNPILKYFDYSPTKKARVGEIPAVDPLTITKPETFIKKSETSQKIKENEDPNFRSNLPPVINNCEKVSNTYLNMNVNMNVLNNQPYYMTSPSSIPLNFGKAQSQNSISGGGHFIHNPLIISNAKTNSNINHCPGISCPKMGMQENYERDFYDPNINNNRYNPFQDVNRKPLPMNAINSLGLPSMENNPDGFYYGPPTPGVHSIPSSLDMPGTTWNHSWANYSQNNYTPYEMFYPNPKSGFYSTRFRPGNLSTYTIDSCNYFSPNYNCLNQNSVEVNCPRGFKNLKNQKNSIHTFMSMNNEELVLHVASLAKDQAGCRFLQKKLEEEQEIAAEMIYPQIIENIIELINDPFGNYLIQKILDYVSKDRLYQLMTIVSPHLSYLGINPHGTRVIQKLIDYLKTEELVKSFIIIFKPHVLGLIKDINGNHIIHKFIQVIPEHSGFIYDIIKNNIIEIATHKHGCCFLQKCIDNSQKQTQTDLIENLINKCRILVVDQYGNYVLQYILSMNNVETNNKIVWQLIQNICYYSKQKYSSNVVEKVSDNFLILFNQCFDCCDEDTRKILIKTVTMPETFIDLLFDMFGNYVVQKALAFSDPDNQNTLLKLIAPLMNNLKIYNFGPKLYNKLLITYPQLSGMVFSLNSAPIMNNCSQTNTGSFNQAGGYANLPNMRVNNTIIPSFSINQTQMPSMPITPPMQHLITNFPTKTVGPVPNLNFNPRPKRMNCNPMQNYEENNIANSYNLQFLNSQWNNQ